MSEFDTYVFPGRIRHLEARCVSPLPGHVFISMRLNDPLLPGVQIADDEIRQIVPSILKIVEVVRDPAILGGFVHVRLEQVASA